MPFTTPQVQNPNNPLELEDREHENLEDQHHSAHSLKFSYKNLEDRHRNARFLEEIYETN